MSTEKEAPHLLELRGRHQCLYQHSNQNRAPCVAPTTVGTEGEGGPNGQIICVKRAADGRRQQDQKIVDEKIEKYRAKNRFLLNTSTDLKGMTFVILINHRSMPIRKERLSPMSKARREASRNEFMEKGETPDRVKHFGEINSRENCPRAWPGFVKPIQNGLRKEQNLIKSRPSKAETSLARRENGIRFQKKKSTG